MVETEDEVSLPANLPDVLTERFLARVPELRAIAQCRVEVMMNLDSAHLGPAQWIAIARRILDRQATWDGIVILHGTDTMAYTAAALSYLLPKLKTRVILTGAQRPLSSIRTDARRNLISAVEIAGSAPEGIRGKVCLYFDDRLWLGSQVRKRNATEFAAFEAPYAAPLAVVGAGIQYLPSRVRQNAQAEAPFLRRLQWGGKQKVFSERVLMVHLTPGFPAQMIRENLLSRLDALVLIVFPSGTAPTHEPEFMEMLARARELGVMVIALAESASHPATPGATSAHASLGRYEAGKRLVEEGCLWAGEVTPEAAMVKAQLICGALTQRLRKDGREREAYRKAFVEAWSQNFASERVDG
jgi:L-asparaginase